MRLIDEFKRIIKEGASKRLDFREVMELEVAKWKGSPERRAMIDGERYYKGEHDILHRKRQVYNANGELVELKKLPNHKLVDNQFAKMVNQKTNFLLSKTITYESENEKYDEILQTIFDARFQRKLKRCGIDAYCGGGSWLYVYIDANGKLNFQRFAPYEILPFWSDNDHEELDCALRLYAVEVYDGRMQKIVEKVEIFTKEGMQRYVLEGSKLIPDVDTPVESYIQKGDEQYTWGRVPLVFFRANSHEIPLINRAKGLQDALNMMLSDLPNAMEENVSGNGILVVKNYGGENLAELRQNLMLYRMMKVETVDGVAGGVESLTIEVNRDNYEFVLKQLKKAIIENCMGYDAKDDRIGSNANTVNIMSMYNDIDLDANDMEGEFQAAFVQLLELVDMYLLSTGKGDYRNVPVTITFNRDMIINEAEIIDNMAKLGVRLSNETLIGQLPFVRDVAKEMERMEEENGKQADVYAAAFPPTEGIEE